MLHLKTVVSHTFSLLKQLLEIPELQGFSLVGCTDLSLLFGHRAKKKDFWDIAELLNYFSVGDVERLHREKYSDQNLMITVPQAITYFADADEDEDPVSLNDQTWASIKKTIQSKVNDFLK